MLLGSRGSRWRCLLVWSSGTSVLAALAVVLGPGAGELWAARASLGALPLDRALLDLASCVLQGCVGWAWLALSATVVEAWCGVRPTRQRHWHVLWHLPAGPRRLVLGGCGVALASALAAPAVASGATPPSHSPGRHPVPALLARLPLPARAVAPPRAVAAAPAPASSASGDSRSARPSTTAVGAGRTVVVAPGDSLWSIAARDLPPGTSAGTVAGRWRAIYAANRGAIGRDPNLIRPGQRLLLPRKDVS